MTRCLWQQCWLASAGADGMVRIWDAATGHVQTMMRADNDLRACSWLSSDAVVIGGAAGCIYSVSFLGPACPPGISADRPLAASRVGAVSRNQRHQICIVASMVSRRAGRTFSHLACGTGAHLTAEPGSFTIIRDRSAPLRPGRFRAPPTSFGRHPGPLNQLASGG
jgi:hypothetical protein